MNKKVIIFIFSIIILLSSCININFNRFGDEISQEYDPTVTLFNINYNDLKLDIRYNYPEYDILESDDKYMFFVCIGFNTKYIDKDKMKVELFRDDDKDGIPETKLLDMRLDWFDEETTYFEYRKYLKDSEVTNYENKTYEIRYSDENISGRYRYTVGSHFKENPNVIIDKSVVKNEEYNLIINNLNSKCNIYIFELEQKPGDFVNFKPINNWGFRSNSVNLKLKKNDTQNMYYWYDIFIFDKYHVGYYTVKKVENIVNEER
jgi:hypothetical protein